MALPLVEIRYSHLTLAIPIAQVADSAGLDTVFSRLAALPRTLARHIGTLCSRVHPVHEIKLIDDVCGSIIPGRLTLLLGAPGSGKSSLLKALTHRLANMKKLQGKVRYSGRTASEAQSAGVQLGQLVQYVSQLDEHSPFLTVRETLSFVARNSLADEDSVGASRRVGDVLNLLHLNGAFTAIISVPFASSNHPCIL
jgi:ABC-type multidrug transport system ATPase subunit